ncbi:hypothetical protein BGP84_01290 [Pseudomonas putida]|uniref:DUF2591 domain-containing protein n=1 Tax=Pseudomonas putida TaxID=303 RepID=A0A2S3X8K9_PSEPU|nr:MULTISPECIES: phage protein NinX family protein [Pseudomonas putida group]POG01275.1 hypothetical protein BGP85_22540 [Pseudomonas putida]POG11940.1 hypothetical protein BGP84_01290 [Pseudomonas putida]
MTDLIEVKTADLVGHALDWAVAQAEGLEVFLVGPQYNVPRRVFWKKRGQALEWDVLYNPHEDWALGGELIEKYAAMVRGFPNQMYQTLAIARVRISGALAWRSGKTPLIALCRAIVAAKLGDTVQVPKELMP